MLRWACGVTTVPIRRDDLLKDTLVSLEAAGFDKPRLFIDAAAPGVAMAYCRDFELEVTSHWPAIRVYGNWVLALAELYIRNPTADRYAVFQDDIVCSRNLRQYLDAVSYPDKGYLNLYTSRSNFDIMPREMAAKGGFYLSNQYGRGALALVFDRRAVKALLTHPEAARHMVERPEDPGRGDRAVDGGVVTALAKVGIKEYVHNPSLVQHMGLQTTVPGRRYNYGSDGAGFRGADYDCMRLLKL